MCERSNLGVESRHAVAMPSTRAATVVDLAENFRRWGEQVLQGLPMYDRIALATADDPDVRDLLLEAPAEQRLPVATRSTQTNEIGRCSVLRPAWGQVAEETESPLGLIELGASAGLNLLLDRWAYSFTPAGPRYGDPTQEVLVEAETRGDHMPPLGPLRAESRIGIDLHPINVRDDEAVRWFVDLSSGLSS